MSEEDPVSRRKRAQKAVEIFTRQPVLLPGSQRVGFQEEKEEEEDPLRVGCFRRWKRRGFCARRFALGHSPEG
jgi:hypothetical protein